MRIAFLLVAAMLVSGCRGDRTEPEYVAEIETWHAERIERLRSDTGWLTLVGLHPLHTGANTLGASPDADVSLPAGAPDWVGTLIVAADQIEFVAHPAAVVTDLAGPEKGRLSSMNLATDKDGPPSRLAAGSLVFYVIDRDGKLFLRVKDRQAETLKNFAGIARFPVDRRWRLEARLEVPAFDVDGEISVRTAPLQPVGGRDGKRLVDDDDERRDDRHLDDDTDIRWDPFADEADRHVRKSDDKNHGDGHHNRLSVPDGAVRGAWIEPQGAARRAG